MARYINGLRFEIEDKISLLNLNTVEYVYQSTLRVEENILRIHNLKNRGRGSVRGSPNRGGKFHTSKDEVEGSSSHTPQRGGFRGGRGRGRNIEVKFYTCGEVRHMTWECLRNKPAALKNANIVEVHEESNEEAKDVNNPPKEG